MKENYIFSFENLSKTYPNGKTVISDLNLSFLPSAKIGIVGANGAGKSSLLKIIAGVDTSFQGEARKSKNIRIGYLPQEPMLENGKTVFENVSQALDHIRSNLQQYNDNWSKIADAESAEEAQKIEQQQAILQDKIDADNAWDIDAQIEMAMQALRCPKGETIVDKLSGGEKRRVALCKLLLLKPELLLLDEPTNHLDAEAVAWLEQHLKDYPHAVIIVTHDRYFLNNITGWILEIDRTKAYPFKGNYTQWLENKQNISKIKKSENEKQQKLISSELEWVRQKPKARQAKSKARLKAYEQLLEQEKKPDYNNAQIIIPNGARLGEKVIEANNLAKVYGDRLLFENLCFKLPRAAIIGVIGPNGAGKSTLCRIICGDEKPSQGQCNKADNVTIAYIEQMRDSLNDDNNVWQEISGGADVIELGPVKRNSRAYVASFNFKGTDQQKKIAQLSGGERNRVFLAKTLKKCANVIMLDEPTNDLDIETLRALEQALLQFAGCAIIVSHDRWFLDRICTHIIAFENDSHVCWFEGNYNDYEKDLCKRLGVNKIIPDRVKHKKFSRN